MKKLLSVFTALLIVVGLCSCKNGGGLFAKPVPTPIPEISPLDLISAEDVYAAINYAYAPVLDGDTCVRDGNKSIAFFRSEPIGQGDPVIIEITQCSDTVSKEDVWLEYDNDRIKRPSAQTIENMGEDAFIAFPSIHVFDKGCYIKITAGSGDTEEQRSSLMTLGSTAAAKLDAIISAQ